MSLKIMWLGQAGFILRSDTGSMAVDPFCGIPGQGYKRLYEPVIKKREIRVDFVVSSHDHWDHFDIMTYRDYVITKALAGPSSCMKLLQDSELKDSLQGIKLDTGMSLERCGFFVTAVPAIHDRDSIGIVVKHSGITIYFSGDTLFDWRLCGIKHFKPDIACICINGKFGNMNYFEAAEYCEILKPKVAIPTHYDLIEHNTENPQNFLNLLPGLNAGTKGFLIEKGIEYDVKEILDC